MVVYPRPLTFGIFRSFFGAAPALVFDNAINLLQVIYPLVVIHVPRRVHENNVVVWPCHHRLKANDLKAVTKLFVDDFRGSPVFLTP